MILFSQSYGTHTISPPLIILHGLFGCSNNWHALAKILSKNFQVYTVDLRNHGRSFHHQLHTYEAMVADLHNFVRARSLPACYLLGHSMGGKVAMHFALCCPQHVRKLLIVDMAPKAYDFREQQAVVAALQRLPIATLRSRKEADEQLAKDIEAVAVRQFLLKNLVRGSQGFTWRMNLPVLAAHLISLSREVTCDAPCMVPACFLRGGQSTYVLPQDYPQLHRIFPGALVREIPQAGHWVHVDDQVHFTEEVLNFFGAP